MKIERKYMAHYIDAAMPDSSSPNYVRLGKDLEEYTAEMSANVEKKQTILGQTSILLTSYEKSASVEPYYAEKGDPLFARLQDIVDNHRILDACKTTVVEVHLWEQADSTKGFPAIMDEAVLEVSSYGGDNTGYQLPFTLHYMGNPQKGYFNPTTKTFTAASTAAK